MKDNITPVYLQIEKDLRKKIINKTFNIGEKLTEKKLAQTYQVNRLTIRKSLSILASEGYIYKVAGKGTFVTSPEYISKLSLKDIQSKKLKRGIGVLVPCVTFSLYSGIIRSIEDFARENGYYIVLGNYDVKPEKEKEYMETFIERGISGLIICASYNSYLNPYYKKLKEREFPFVVVDTIVEGIEADFVSTDNVKGGYIATKSLIQKGCKKIAFLCGYFSASSSKERLAGYKTALAEHNISIDANLIKYGFFTEEFGYKTTKELLSQNKLDGFFSANEPITIGILKAIKELNYKIPEQIKIVSFDEPDLPLGFKSDITLIAQPRYEIGKVATELLLERIKEKRNKIKASYRKILLEPKLIEVGVKEDLAVKI